MQSLNELDPLNFGALITHISAATIKAAISDKLKHQNLAPLEKSENQVEQIRTGIIYGAQNRTFFSIPTRFKNNKPIWIHYLFMTGAPKTYLSSQALRALVGPDIEIKDNIPVFINGRQIVVGISSHHYECENILGMDFMITTKELKYLLPEAQQASIIIRFY